MGLIGFSANSIQFGLDQLHDAATEDLILYIHWFVWTSYAGLLPMKLGFDTIVFKLCTSLKRNPEINSSPSRYPANLTILAIMIAVLGGSVMRGSTV